MPLPASYSESSLGAFMEVELGPVGEDLGMLDTDALLEAVNEVSGLLGHAIAAETDVMKLRALARWQAWLAARKAAARQFDTKPGSGRDFKLTDVWKQINYELSQAAMAAAVYVEGAGALTSGFVTITSINQIGPYGVLAGSEF